MKIIILLSALVFATSPAKAQIIKAELVANGLTCSMCSNATLKQLNTLDFIDSIEVDLENTSFILFFKNNREVDIVKIKNKVESAGFSVGSLVLNVNFLNQKIENHLLFDFEKQHFIGMDTKSELYNGRTQVKILNKGFVSDKEFKSLLKSAVGYPTLEEGINAEGNLLFHIKII